MPHFLSTDYELEEQVLASDWAKELLGGTRSAGVVGVGYIQGPMRRPLGLTRELVELSDYKGARIGIRAVRIDRDDDEGAGRDAGAVHTRRDSTGSTAWRPT